MTTQYLRFEAVTDSLSSANSLASALQTLFDGGNKHADGIIAGGTVYVSEPPFLDYAPFVNGEVRYVDDISRTSVKQGVQALPNNVLNKIVWAKIYEHECSHDEATPVACSDVEVFSWP